MSNEPIFSPLPSNGPGWQPRAAGPDFNSFRRDLFAATPRIFVTRTLIGANIAVFILMVLSGHGGLFSPSPQQMIRFGAGYGPLTAGGQPWRLFTEMFVHFGIIHIGMNMYVLWQGGPLIERLFGNFAYLVIYIFSGLFGSFLSLRAHPDALAAGASGAVFGVYGALLGFLAVQRLSIPPAFLRSLFSSVGLFIVYNLVFGLSLKEVDMYAHGGGLVAGLVLGALLSRKLIPGANQNRAIGVAIVCTAVSVLVGLHLGFWTHPVPISPG